MKYLIIIYVFFLISCKTEPHTFQNVELPQAPNYETSNEEYYENGTIKSKYVIIPTDTINEYDSILDSHVIDILGETFFIMWHPNGQLMSIELLENGNIIVRKEFDENGKLLSTKEY